MDWQIPAGLAALIAGIVLGWRLRSHWRPGPYKIDLTVRDDRDD